MSAQCMVSSNQCKVISTGVFISVLCKTQKAFQQMNHFGIRSCVPNKGVFMAMNIAIWEQWREGQRRLGLQSARDAVLSSSLVDCVCFRAPSTDRYGDST